MSLYNMVCGYNPACILLLPMLGRKPEGYPRFRDCFVTDDKKRILVYTRVGGNNRNQGYGEQELYKDPNFVSTYDDGFDSTYGNYEFNVPEKWKEDFGYIIGCEFDKVSDEYVKYVEEFYPILAKEGIIKKLFGRGDK